MIYTISEEKEPINSCTSKSESIFNPNSNSDNNNNENTGSSSIQYGNEDNSDLDSDPNSKTFIALPDLTKEQELKWFNNNNEGIMSEHVHDTNVGFDLRYPGKDTYIIEPNEKIAQAIFLSLVKIAQLVSVENREELEITARGIQGFESTDRVDIPVNMVKEEIIDKGEIISTSQPISIPPYNQYIVVIKKKVKNQNQIFEAEVAHCESREIGLINLYIPAKNYNCIKIPIYNNIGKIIEISEGTIIGHLTTKIEDQLPNPIPDFPQLCQTLEAVLLQKEPDGKEHSVTYASRGLTPAKRNYRTLSNLLGSYEME
ncbi:hypothetical protein G9A89_006396 [Geosiphon pyriformis]|nr:hypothetical protein G9A89_006396 [Geosiphon pyriformis]